MEENLGPKAPPRMLEGVRILVVEDWLPLAAEAAVRLEDAGAQIVGPVGRLPQALELAQRAEIDVALLDVDLHGERVFPVAYTLQERGIPFILTTGFGSPGVPPDLGAKTLLEKPFDYSSLARCIAAAVA